MYNGSYFYFSLFVCGLRKKKRILRYPFPIFYHEIEKRKTKGRYIHGPGTHWSKLGRMLKAQNGRPSTDAPVVISNCVRLFNISISKYACCMTGVLSLSFGKISALFSKWCLHKNLQLVSLKKNLYNRQKYGDIVIDLFMINTYESLLRHMMSSYGYP